MSFLKQRGQRWYLYYREGGRQRAKALGTDSLQAKKIKIKHDHETTFNGFGIVNQDISWTDFKTAYYAYCQANKRDSTFQRDKDAIRNFEAIVGPRNLQVPPAKIETWKQQRLTSVKAATVNIEYNSLKAAFSRAVAWGYLAKNPFKQVKKLRTEKKIPRFLSQEEVKNLRAHATGETKLMCLVFLYTGVRVSELVHLRWEDIKDGYIHLKSWGAFQLKDHEERKIPIHKELGKALQRPKDGQGIVFPGQDGPRSRHALTRLFQRLYKRAGIKGATIHTLRHTFASHFIMSGGNLAALQKLCGHSHINTTMIYAHLAQAHIEEAVQRLNFKR